MTIWETSAPNGGDERASDLTGQATDTVVGHDRDQAQDGLRRVEILDLSPRDWDRLLDALDNPAPPNAALRRAVQRHQVLVRPPDGSAGDPDPS